MKKTILGSLGILLVGVLLFANLNSVFSSSGTTTPTVKIKAGQASTSSTSQGYSAGGTFVALSSGTCTGTTITNPSNAASSDDVYATSQAGLLKPESQCLKATSFGFTVPTGATITGIQAQLERKRASVGSGTITDGTIQLVVAGSLSGNNKAAGGAWGTSDVTVTYGSSSDTWGLTLTPADVNGSTFGVAASGAWSGVTGNRNFSLDMLQLKVFYDVPTTISSVKIKASQTIKIKAF